MDLKEIITVVACIGIAVVFWLIKTLLKITSDPAEPHCFDCNEAIDFEKGQVYCPCNHANAQTKVLSSCATCETTVLFCSVCETELEPQKTEC
jgi:hypothetical protein